MVKLCWQPFCLEYYLVQLTSCHLVLNYIYRWCFQWERGFSRRRICFRLYIRCWNFWCQPFTDGWKVQISFFSYFKGFSCNLFGTFYFRSIPGLTLNEDLLENYIYCNIKIKTPLRFEDVMISIMAKVTAFCGWLYMKTGKCKLSLSAQSLPIVRKEKRNICYIVPLINKINISIPLVSGTR